MCISITNAIVLPAITTCYVLIYYLSQHAYTKILCSTGNYFSYPIAKAGVLLWNTWSIGISSYKIRPIVYHIIYCI